jgi:hypothetical protein
MTKINQWQVSLQNNISSIAANIALDYQIRLRYRDGDFR